MACSASTIQSQSLHLSIIGQISHMLKASNKEIEWNSSFSMEKHEIQSYISALSLVLAIIIINNRVAYKRTHIIVASNDSSTTSALNVPVYVNS